MTRRSQLRGWSLRRALAHLAVVALLGSAAPMTARGVCTGDCNGDCQVTVNEIVTIVSIALGSADISACSALPSLGGPVVEISGITDVINNALLGCPAGSCASACGNGHVDAGEDCDDGGICIGGSNAGTACTAEAQCSGNGVCDDGSKFGYGCATGDDCPNGHCVHCKTFGGDGCAANCTLETHVLMSLIPGMDENGGAALQAGTSGIVAVGDIVTVPMPLSGSQALTLGKAGRDGRVPLVIKAANVHIPRRLIVPTLIDGCLRAVALQTCGGTLFDLDGSASPSCTPGFGGQVSCPAERPCTFVHGPGNSASGSIACGVDGLLGPNVLLTADGSERRPAQPQFTGLGPRGAAIVLNSFALGSADVPLPGGCSDEDPVEIKGYPVTSVSTTGTACCEMANANMLAGNEIGPICTTGSPFNCDALSGAILTGGMVGVSPLLSPSVYGDACVATQFFADPSPPRQH